MTAVIVISNPYFKKGPLLDYFKKSLNWEPYHAGLTDYNLATKKKKKKQR